MADLSPCPLCKSTFTYELDAMLACPECGHEWDPNTSDISEDVFVVKDANGNIFQVATDDPRIKSGELVGITKGSKQTLESNKKRSETMTGKKMPQPYVKCEYCGKSTSKTNIIRWHKKCEINKSGFDCI